ncbi:TPA: hypothetical protein NJ265_000717 [Vibrio parahaemolyticus]|uniref:flavodoxin family protein n=1 Tax=Vibrio parahaemolyticus TaxID=670 RepID=UPI0015DDA290|nr:hypothetical protein [Vibrio parahaemolyticus]MBE4438203.1 hypothetical protein [Vibrio parahaemolyticus]MCR9880437.1 hypothetical protein [Vibrio parahaemolyticus]MCR9893664.1 hypothetical protein [Vibrio parahaemolyticus]MCR9957591.1 hypothetical protein [Vibrio parahaemolyticus]MDF5055775.1 hypothetical protein [Vibrio parahaemolyticus]
MFRWTLIVLFILFIFLMVVALVVTQIENSQYRKHKQKQQHLQHSLTGESKTAIVVFSRSGNTATLSEHIANKTNGHVYEIFAKSYALGIPGWISALKDARSNVAEIVPQHIDLSSYNTVYLGSPIWLYSPAPPIWQFVKDNDLTNKRVILFNSFNSKFEQHFIDEFAALVRAKGATSFEHQYVKRGRMGDQLSTDEMLAAFDHLTPQSISSR